MALTHQIGYGAQALELNQFLQALDDRFVVSGLAASTGANAMEVDIASGTIYHDGEVSVSSATVTLDSADSTDPRKDVIHVNSSGTVAKTSGNPNEAAPSGEVRRNTHTPAPPDLSGQDVIALAEIWVPAGASDITSSDISDRRVLSPTPAVQPDMIAVWSGTIANIPSGWVICDGNNGTPNLQDKFVVGAGNSYAVDATGGESTHTLTESELASHNHTADMDETAGAVQTATRSDGSGGGTLTTTNAGGDSAHENKPPYHALAYIMRV